MNRRHFLGAVLVLASAPLIGRLPPVQKIKQRILTAQAERRAFLQHYDMILLNRTLPSLRLLDFGQTRSLPRNSGKEITFRTFSDIPDAYGFFETESLDALKTYNQPWEDALTTPSIGHRVVYDTEILNENWLMKVDDGPTKES